MLAPCLQLPVWHHSEMGTQMMWTTRGEETCAPALEDDDIMPAAGVTSSVSRVLHVREALHGRRPRTAILAASKLLPSCFGEETEVKTPTFQYGLRFWV